jgi:hypothetical protein
MEHEILHVKCENFFSPLVARTSLPIGTAPLPLPLPLLPKTGTKITHQSLEFVPITSSVPWRSWSRFQFRTKLQKENNQKRVCRRQKTAAQKRKKAKKEKRTRNYAQWCAERQKEPKKN